MRQTFKLYTQNKTFSIQKARPQKSIVTIYRLYREKEHPAKGEAIQIKFSMGKFKGFIKAAFRYENWEKL